MDENIVSQTSNSPKIIPIVVASVLIIALAIGGGVYAYQKNQNDKTQADLQSQITELQRQISVLKSVVSTPTPIAPSLPSSTPVAILPTATPTTPASYLSASQLLNFTYKNLNGQNVTLKNGKGTFAITGGPGELTIVQNGPAATARGDLDGDGIPDSVVYLVENDGGTGSFPLIAAVLNKNGQPVLSGVHSILEDRAVVSSIIVKGGVITVAGKVRSSGQPLSDEGNISKMEVYKVVDGKLIAQ